MTEKIIINRNDIWITIEPVILDKNGNLEEEKNQFVCYFNRTKPGLIKGEQFKDQNNIGMVFSSVEEAKQYAIKTLEHILYPPSFLSPSQYNYLNYKEIMDKEVLIEIGLDNIDRTIKGKITKCSAVFNNPDLIASIGVQEDNENIVFYSIKEVRTISHP
jgi:hypothetical protein